MSAGTTYWIFRSTWYTTFGIRKPIKKLDWRATLLGIPLCAAILGTWSIILDSDWTNPIQLMPKAVALSVWATLGFSLYQWFRSPNPMDMTLEAFLKHLWPKTRQVNIDEYRTQIGSDAELTEMFETGSVFRIPKTNLEALVIAYLGYLESIGHKIQDSFFSMRSENFGSISFRSENAGDQTSHHVIYCGNTEIAVFHEPKD